MTDLASEYRNLHATQPRYGSADKRLAGFTQPLIRSLSATNVIDYGCGKGTLGTAIEEATSVSVRLYDPYVPEFSERPNGRFDLLVNTDVLEHVPENDLPQVLLEMASLSEHCFIVISTRYADHLLSDGANAHCTVRSDDWWEGLLREYFTHVQAVDVGVPDTCAFLTWPLPEDASTEFRKILRKEVWPRKLKRRRSLIASWLKERTGFFATLTDLHDDIKGKSIAVVGNAQSLVGSDRGQEIDSHDWVIRFNRAPIASIRSHGKQTDWLATGMPLDSDFKRRRGVKRMLWLSSYRKHMTKSLLQDPSTYMIDKDYYRSLEVKLGTLPSSGFIILDILSKSDCGNVDIYGFDFFETKSLSCHLDIDETHHNFPSEKRLVEDLCARDNRFSMR